MGGGLVRATAPHLGSDQVDSRQQSCAEGSPRSGGGCAAPAPPASPASPPVAPPPGQAGAAAGVTRRGDSRKSDRKGAGLVSHPAQSPHSAPSALVLRVFSLGSGQERPLKRPLRGHPGVAGRFRRVVVPRRCTQHHLRRVMVETPPRAGPSPPHGPARFSCPPSRAGAPRPRRLPRAPPAPSGLFAPSAASSGLLQPLPQPAGQSPGMSNEHPTPSPQQPPGGPGPYGRPPAQPLGQSPGPAYPSCPYPSYPSSSTPPGPRPPYPAQPGAPSPYGQPVAQPYAQPGVHPGAHPYGQPGAHPYGWPGVAPWPGVPGPSACPAPSAPRRS